MSKTKTSSEMVRNREDEKKAQEQAVADITQRLRSLIERMIFVLDEKERQLFAAQLALQKLKNPASVVEQTDSQNASKYKN